MVFPDNYLVQMFIHLIPQSTTRGCIYSLAVTLQMRLYGDYCSGRQIPGGCPKSVLSSLPCVTSESAPCQGRFLFSAMHFGHFSPRLISPESSLRPPEADIILSRRPVRPGPDRHVAIIARALMAHDVYALMPSLAKHAVEWDPHTPLSWSISNKVASAKCRATASAHLSLCFPRHHARAPALPATCQ